MIRTDQTEPHSAAKKLCGSDRVVTEAAVASSETSPAVGAVWALFLIYL